MFKILKSKHTIDLIRYIIIVIGVIMIPWFFTYKQQQGLELVANSLVKTAEEQIKNISYDYAKVLVNGKSLDFSKNIIKTEIDGTKYLIIKLENEDSKSSR